ncbi:MAG: SHOCT domain-containing protein [Deltaproteobacteria bacterium]|nr:SHOCT domain-containing protein [Deltaproteobacteria bacterium]
MIKRYGLLLPVVFAFALPGLARADAEYIYRQRINWVKLDRASPKDVPLGSLKHPYTGLTVEQMEGMLLSVKISKRFLLKKEIDSADVFNSYEAKKYAPFIVEALAKATPDQVAHFSIIHKRPFFILRNDRLTMGNVWAADDGIHFQFQKLFAKITGDYEASAQMDKAIRNAKSLRVTLEAGEGQQLSYASATEIILDPGYDFVAQAYREQEEDRLAEEEEMKGKKAKKEAKKKKEESQDLSPAPTASRAAKNAPSSASGDVAARLRRLDALKKEKLITEQEYQQKRKEILSEI